MLNEAVKWAKGIKTEENFETAIDVDIDAYIPASYIPNEIQKLDLYKRIAGNHRQVRQSAEICGKSPDAGRIQIKSP